LAGVFLLSGNMMASAVHSPFCPPDRSLFVLVVAILASAMGFIDGSVVSIAIPAIRADLAAVQWINNAYALSLSAFILVGGAAGDRFGTVRVFFWGIALFVIASVLCALAPTAETLIAARAFKGLGAAIMVPGSLAILSKSYPADERGKAIGTWAAASAITTALGPALGGVLLSFGDDGAWRLIFAINLPIGAVCLWLLLTKIPRDKSLSKAPPDWVGALAVTLSLGAMAWALTNGGTTWALLGIGTLIAFLWIEHRIAHPMMPLFLWRRPGFAAANALTFFLYFGLSAALFFLPMTLITGWSVTEIQAVVIFLPLTIFIGLLSSKMGALSDRLGPRPLLAFGTALVGLSYALIAATLPLLAFWTILLPLMCVAALGMALVVAPLSAAVMGSVNDEETGAASGVNNAMSRVAGLIAVAAMGPVASWGAGMDFGGEGSTAAAMNAGLAVVLYVAAALSFLSSAIALIGLMPRQSD
jgi:EmrB/QacA subfamily drug resistance transporter